MDISKLSIGGIALVFLIIGLIQFAKGQGWISGTKQIQLVAAGLGIFFGALYEVTQLFPGAATYVSVFIFVVAFGLAATGLFDTAKELATSPPNQSNK